LALLTPDGYVARIDLTITDDYPLAEAVVIISCLASKAEQRG
jgi:holo-[acyl-carrier protein] synthase